MAYRKVVGLEFAEQCERPACIPRPRVRGTRALGLGYERGVAKALARDFPQAGVVYGQWFRFRDVNGWGYCQPDFLFYRVGRDDYVIGECKLTYTQEAMGQMRDLYFPVVAKATGIPVSGGILITKHLTRATAIDRIFEDLGEALVFADCGHFPVWHYLGKGPARRAGGHAYPASMPPALT